MRPTRASSGERERLINDVISVLEKNKFIGVNVDFEELKENTDEVLAIFRDLPFLDEVSIGHAILSRAVFVGLATVVREYLAVLAAAEGVRA